MKSIDIMEAKEDLSSTLQLQWIILSFCLGNIIASFLYFQTDNEHELRLKTVAITLFAVGGIFTAMRIRTTKKIAPVHFERGMLFKALVGVLLSVLCTILYLFTALGGIRNPF